jgi:hypothetical protein
MDFQQQKADKLAVNLRLYDRRAPSLSTLHGALFKSRRRHSRREQDQFNNYIDWHGYKPLIATLIITLLCFADAFLTTVLLSKGAVEVNILMDWLIQKDLHAFTIVKMGVTGIGLLILVMHSNFMVYKYITVRHIIYALVPLYTLLILHELNMLANI